MLCFRDKTFCDAPVHHPDCKRKWTPELQAEAERWWGDKPNGPPVAFSNLCGGPQGGREL